MKKFLIILFSVLMTSGCFGEEDFNDVYTYTSLYPIEYATSELYRDMSNIVSIYPNEANIKEYSLTDKQKNNYSSGEVFVYSGVASEAGIAKDLLNLNSKIKLIDATKGMNTTYSMEETWLDPSNFLMICRNIKSSLIEYTDNVYTKEKIENNYKVLKENISVIDVELYNISKNGNYDTLLVTSNVFSYLEKYNIKIISLDIANSNIDKNFAEARRYINEKQISYIFTLKDQKLSEATEKLINDNNLIRIDINPMYTLTDSERKNNENYISLMNKILENYKKELYKR